MMKIIIIASVLTFGASVKLPPNFPKCNRKQSDLQNCILKAAQKAIPLLSGSYEELNIPNINPVEVSEVNIDGGSGPVAVNQTFKNCKFYGLIKMRVDKFEFNFDKKTVDLDGTFPEVQMRCDYIMKGKVLVIPVNGAGNSTITLNNLKMTAHQNYEETKKKSKTYIRIVKSVLTLDPELVTYEFLNHKDRRLSDNINPVLNDNWKEVFDEVKGGYIEVMNQIIVKLLNGIFSKVSLEEALDD